jgi:hypothetical protein
MTKVFLSSLIVVWFIFSTTLLGLHCWSNKQFKTWSCLEVSKEPCWYSIITQNSQKTQQIQKESLDSSKIHWVKGFTWILGEKCVLVQSTKCTH